MGPSRVHLLCRDPVFFHDIYFSTSSSSLLDRSSILTFLKEFFSTRAWWTCLQEGKGGGIDHSCCDHVNALGLGYTLLYGLLYRLIKCSTSKSLGHASIDPCLDYEYHIRAQVWCRGSARVLRESYESVLSQSQNNGDSFAHSNF